MKRKPQIRVISQASMNKIAKQPKGFNPTRALLKGQTVYLTKKASDLDREHELAHYKLGHRGAALRKRVNVQQFVTREIKAEKMACDKLGKRVKRKDLESIVDGTRDLFKHTGGRREVSMRVKGAVNKVASQQGIKYRV